MKKFLSIITIFIVSSLICFGQKLPKKNDADIQQEFVKKQAAIVNFASQIKNVPYVAIRNYTRSKTAAWLWQNGKDETGQAEDLAAQAFAEIQERKNEIPEIYFSSLQSELLTLLENNSPATARKLKKKYNISDEENLDSAYSLLGSKNGEKNISEKLKSFLNSQSNEISSTAADLIFELSSRKSPELAAILLQIVNSEETGASNFSPDSLFLVVDAFRNSLIPNDLQIRFYKIILKKAREAAASGDDDADAAYRLLYAVSPDISKNALDLLAESAALQASLRGRVDNVTKENDDVYEKIENSSDRLSAMISAAETAENEPLKKALYNDAALLALKKKKFKLAVELLAKSQDGEDFGDEKNKFPLRWHDQFLGDVVDLSLKSDDTEASKYALDKIIDKLIRAEALRKTADYYFEKQSFAAAADVLDEALKIADKTDDNVPKIRTLLRLIPAFQKINKMETGEVVEKTAKAINSLPTPNIDDKPETENYKKYVAAMIGIDTGLLITANSLIKENKNEVLNLANGINRQEIKIILDFVILNDSLK